MKKRAGSEITSESANDKKQAKTEQLITEQQPVEQTADDRHDNNNIGYSSS